MGASEALTDPSSLYNVGNNDLSDTETVLNVRNALASVQNVSLASSSLMCLRVCLMLFVCLMLSDYFLLVILSGGIRPSLRSVC